MKDDMSSNRKILIGLSSAAFLGPFTQTIYTPSLSEVGHFFTANPLMVNLTISLYTIILAFSQFIIGPLSDKRGRRRTLLPGLLIFLIGSMICFLTTNYTIFLIGRSLQALGISAGSVVAAAVIGDIYPPDKRSGAMSVYQTMIFLGPVLGPILGSLIAAYVHWQWVFAVLSLGALVSYIYNRLILHETLEEGTSSRKITSKTFKKILSNKAGLSIMVLAFFQFYGYYTYLVFLPSLLDHFFHVSLVMKGLLFLPLTVGIALGTIVGGKLQVHLTRKAIMVSASYGIGATVLLFSLCLTLQLLTMPMLVFFLLTYGVLLGASLPAQTTILINIFGEEKGTAMGVYNFIRFVGTAVAPLIGAYLYKIAGWYALYDTLFICLFLAGIFVHKYMFDPYEKSAQVI
ncbi:MFS transporter [Halobacillus mangrovi]|nr:MFS transporter [Halobacillus mangrovi]